MKTKQLYGVEINWYGQTFRFYRHARSIRHATELAGRALAERVEEPLIAVYNYINYRGGDCCRVWKEGANV